MVQTVLSAFLLSISLVLAVVIVASCFVRFVVLPITVVIVIAPELLLSRLRLAVGYYLLVSSDIGRCWDQRELLGTVEDAFEIPRVAILASFLKGTTKVIDHGPVGVVATRVQGLVEVARRVHDGFSGVLHVLDSSEICLIRGIVSFTDSRNLIVLVPCQFAVPDHVLVLRITIVVRVSDVVTFPNHIPHRSVEGRDVGVVVERLELVSLLEDCPILRSPVGIANHGVKSFNHGSIHRGVNLEMDCRGSEFGCLVVDGVNGARDEGTINRLLKFDSHAG